MQKLVSCLLIAAALMGCSLSQSAPTATSATITPFVETSTPSDPSELPVVGFTDIVPSGAAPCVLFANDRDVPVYTMVDATQPPIVILAANTGLVTFSHDSSGWYAVNYSVSDAQYSGWVQEAGVRVEGECDYLYAVEVCSVQSNVGRNVDIYAAPSRDSEIVSVLGDIYTVPFVEFSADGWFGVYQGEAPTGWIAPEEGVLVGPCDIGS